MKKRGLRLTQPQLMHLKRLLPMEYTPPELANEIGLDIHRFRRVFLPAGVPYRKDGNGHLWIIGEEFTAWYKKTIKTSKHPMLPGEAWCLRCRKAVPMQNTTIKATQKYTEII